MPAKRRKKKRGHLPQESFARGIFFTILGMTVFWGSLLTVFSLFGLADVRSFNDVVYHFLFAALGLIAWLNFYHYVDVAKEENLIERWTAWYHKNTDPIHLAAVFTLLYELVVLGRHFDWFAFREGFNAFFSVISVPSFFATNIMSVIYEGTSQFLSYLPAVAAINRLGIFVAVAFQFILFYYISQVLFWAPQHRKNHR